MEDVPSQHLPLGQDDSSGGADKSFTCSRRPQTQRESDWQVKVTTAAGRKHLLCLVRGLVRALTHIPLPTRSSSLRARRAGLDHSLHTLYTPPAISQDYLKQTQSDLLLYHMCSKQDKAQSPPAGKTIPLLSAPQGGTTPVKVFMAGSSRWIWIWVFWIES